MAGKWNGLVLILLMLPVMVFADMSAAEIDRASRLKDGSPDEVAKVIKEYSQLPKLSLADKVVLLNYLPDDLNEDAQNGRGKWKSGKFDLSKFATDVSSAGLINVFKATNKAPDWVYQWPDRSGELPDYGWGDWDEFTKYDWGIRCIANLFYHERINEEGLVEIIKHRNDGGILGGLAQTKLSKLFLYRGESGDNGIDISPSFITTERRDDDKKPPASSNFTYWILKWANSENPEETDLHERALEYLIDQGYISDLSLACQNLEICDKGIVFNLLEKSKFKFSSFAFELAAELKNAEGQCNPEIIAKMYESPIGPYLKGLNSFQYSENEDPNSAKALACGGAYADRIVPIMAKDFFTDPMWEKSEPIDKKPILQCADIELNGRTPCILAILHDKRIKIFTCATQHKMNVFSINDGNFKVVFERSAEWARLGVRHIDGHSFLWVIEDSRGDGNAAVESIYTWAGKEFKNAFSVNTGTYDPCGSNGPTTVSKRETLFEINGETYHYKHYSDERDLSLDGRDQRFKLIWDQEHQVMKEGPLEYASGSSYPYIIDRP